MKKIFAVLLFASLLVSAEQLYAWGFWAHKFITYTADKHLDSAYRLAHILNETLK